MKFKYQTLSEGDLLFSDDGRTYICLGHAGRVDCPNCRADEEYTYFLCEVDTGEYYLYFCACRVLCKIDISTECESPQLFVHEKEE